MSFSRRVAGCAVAAWLMAGSAHAQLLNGDFASYTAAGEGGMTYQEGSGPPGWYVQDAEDGFDVITDASLDSPAGASVLRPNVLTGGFGASKLEQCVPVDNSRRLTIDYLAFTPASNPDGLAVRVNPNFYADMEACIDALRRDDNGARLGGNDNNEDLDADVGSQVDTNEWTRISVDGDGRPMTYGPAGSGAEYLYPDGANAMYFSLRFRDRSGADNTPTGLEIYVDDVRVIQEGSAANLIVNGDFSHAGFVDGDFIVGGSEGWFLDRFTDFPAAVGPAWFALAGGNVYYSEGQAGGFGDSKLDQCFALGGGERLAPEAFVRSDVPSVDLAGRIALRVYDAADCGGTELVDLEANFPGFGAPGGDPEAGRWYSLLTAAPPDGDVMNLDLAEDYPDAVSAFISVRVRDRSGEGSNPTANLPRAVYFDSVNMASEVATPVFDPLPGGVPAQEGNISVTLQSDSDGVMIVYTIDGSDPDPETAETVSNGDAVSVAPGTELRAMAVGTNMAVSSVRSAVYPEADDNGAPGDPGSPGDGHDGSDPRISSGASGSVPGCTVGSSDRVDPTLLLMLMVAAGWGAWRYRRN